MLSRARKELGQLFLIGFPGLELSDDTSAFISQAGIGGVILFAQNYDSPGQLAELINQVQECRADLPLWIGIDHEGGRIQRFKKGFTRIPDAASITATDSPRLAFEIAEMMAKELKSVGINLNFAPVADINTNPKNPVIGVRSFGADEETVSKMSSAFVRGHLIAGVQACVKHFPGHGDTQQDSHFTLPKVSTPLETLKEREFRPFVKAFKGRCNFVMTAHIVNPTIDPKFPATLSSIFLRDILRKEIRYQKIVVSDDMEMKAITDHFGAEDAPRMAIEAGCDMLLYRTEAGGRHAYASLLKALESGQLRSELVCEAADRIKAVKKECLLPYQPVLIADLREKINTGQNQALVARVAASEE